MVRLLSGIIKSLMINHKPTFATYKLESFCFITSIELTGLDDSGVPGGSMDCFEF